MNINIREIPGKCLAYALSLYRKSLILGKRVGWWKVSLGGGILLGVFITLIIVGGEAEAPVLKRAPRAVSVRTIAELSLQEAPLPVVGTVTSQSEAAIRSESAGQVTGLYRELGDYVSAGSIIAEMENSSERATVLQAEGGVEAAQAQLLKLTRGARDEQLSILRANVDNAESGLASAQAAAVNALLSAYSIIDESVRRKSDQMFSNPDTATPKLIFIVSDGQLIIDLESERARLRKILERQNSLSSTLTASDTLSLEIATTEGEAREIKNFLDKLVSALNKATPSDSVSTDDIASFKTDANAARTSMNSSLASLVSARETLVNRGTAVEVAKKNLEQGVVGGQAEDVAATQASLKQAQGSLASARSALEKTIVRSPISGTLNMLAIKQGDFLSSFIHVATVANNTALEVLAYITESDAPDIAVGTTARIEKIHEGIVTRIAPALNPVTKKIEVRIGLKDKAELVNGQAVTVELSRAGRTLAASKMVVPLSALKVGAKGNLLFTLDENNKLVPHEVGLGELLGDSVVIETGVTPDLSIVLDARGLKAGETVTLK